METEADLGDNELSTSISHRRRSASVSDDYSVQKTNDDATESKFSAVKVRFFPGFLSSNLFIVVLSSCFLFIELFLDWILA